MTEKRERETKRKRVSFSSLAFYDKRITERKTRDGRESERKQKDSVVVVDADVVDLDVVDVDARVGNEKRMDFRSQGNSSVLR